MKKLSHVVLIALGLLLLFGTSELIFMYKNNPQFMLTYYIWRAQMVADKDLQKSVGFFVLGADKLNKSVTGEMNPYTQDYGSSVINISQDSDLGKDMRNYIHNSNLWELFQDHFYSYPRMLYDLSLIAYKDNDPELFVSLMQFATVKDMSMSYWPVELANYYYSTGNTQKAFEILEDCQKLNNTKIHCGQIEETFKKENKSFEVGFLKQAVEDIYKHNSLDY